MVKDVERALWSIHALLVAGRARASENAPPKELAAIFDAAEVLPLYILEERDNTDLFRSVLQDAAARNSLTQRALNGFDGAIEVGHHYRGHLTPSPERSE